jgi:O-antigen ligase
MAARLHGRQVVSEFVYLSVLATAAFLAAMMAAFTVAGATHYAKGRHSGWLQYYFYVLFAYMAVIVLFSHRELTAASADVLSESPTGSSAVTAWTSRFASVFLVLSSLERIFSVWLSREKRTLTAIVLAIAFIAFWLATVAAPAFLGRHRFATHDNLYPLLIGWAAIQFSASESKAALIAARNGTLLFILLGYLVLPFKPHMVMETGYTQGYIPGLPRFAGLAPHAVALGLLVQIALLLIWQYPFKRVWVNRCAWILCLSALFLAQSKTAWVSFALSAAIMLMYRNAGTVRRRLFDPARPQLLVAAIAVLLIGVMFIAGVSVFGEVGSNVRDYLDSAEGSQLMTLTGREKIWAIALNEFYANPLFGYGPSLFSPDYRQSIGMPFATHGHNQLIDTLGRSGLVGTVALISYFVILTVLAVKYASATRGLSLAVYTVLALRCVSEVPLAITTNTQEFAAHLTLLIVLVGAAHLKTSVSAKKPKVFATPLWATGGVLV